MKIQACLTNNSDLWKTPKKLYEMFISQNYYDPCPANPQFNGLEIDWQKLNFVNPPYSQIEKWIDKALIEREKKHYSIFLIPARTDTKWFKKLVNSGAKIYFIQGRLKFNDSNPAPFPSMFVELNAERKTTYEIITKEQRQIITT